MTRPGQAMRWGISLASAAYLGALALLGISFSSGVDQALAYLPALLGLFVVGFEKWFWRWPIVRNAVGRPRIDGTWLGEIHPRPRDGDESLDSSQPVHAALLIEQSLWTLSIALLTAESRSSSTSAAFGISPEGSSRRKVYYTYENRPQQKHLQRSVIHSGAAQIEVTGMLPDQASGFYWTERSTSGDMHFRLASRNTHYTSLGQVLDGESSAMGPADGG